LDRWWKFKYSKRQLAGAGTQTAGLAFGGKPVTKQQKNTMDQLGHSGGNLKQQGTLVSRLWYTNSRFSFWWYSSYYWCNRRIRWNNLDNMDPLNTARSLFSRCRYTNSWISFWWLLSSSFCTGATEEYNGTSWTTKSRKFKYSKKGLAGAGIQTAALAFGGKATLSVTPIAATEEYDGATWTTSPASLVNSKNIRWSRNYNSSISFWW
jgi:hypothetical protein